MKLFLDVFSAWRGFGLYGVALASLLGCAEHASLPPGERVASYRGGEVSLRDAEEALRMSAGLGSGRTTDPGKDSVDELVLKYKVAAESVVLDRVLLTNDNVEEMLAELGPKGRELQRQVSLALFLASRIQEQVVAPEEVEAYYTEHRGQFHRPAERRVWHIFSRHRDQARPEETLQRLLELKRRAEAGEGFSQLAEQHSDSETRVIGGRLGLIRAGRLPKALEEKVFALPAGGVSQPIPVPGGAALFYVSEAFEERDFPLEDVRVQLTNFLAQNQRRARLAELVADREPPPGSTVLDFEALVAALSGADRSAVVLSMGDTQLTAGELGERLERASQQADPLFQPPPRERLRLAYEDLVREELLALAASEVELSQAQQRSVDERLRQLARHALGNQRLEDAMRRLASENETELQRFYDDNRHLYQTPLKLKLKTLSIAAGARAAERLAQLENARRELASGALDLATAATRMGGTVADLGWIDFDTLMTYEAKIYYYVLDLNGPGYTVPFHLNGRLSLVWVEAREEPREEPFEQVRERVAADYFERRQQPLYRRAVDALLAAESFRFDEESVRAALAPPMASSSSPNPLPAPSPTGT